ncbi:outer dynein arm-docking complex subunit 4 isoform X2 [Cottoperca gobio]|uniref:Outer dynein arm-docking complex subunit 4 n=1 Tax=Cottoperca gobio TaxID=56716 RepID=A0A6J2Q4T7_COTGO|nr:tetratricopeptide repeat protein 25 isoform X2 [Cottoperca gobio]
MFSLYVSGYTEINITAINKDNKAGHIKALTLKPDDKTCFVGRSKCYLKMGQSENALKDAEASLEEDKSFSEGLYQKAEALYYMGEFEFGLVFYHRGQKIRPQIQEFRLGIQKAQEAIENSVGSPSSVKLKIKGDLSFLKKDEERAPPLAAIQHLMRDKTLQTQKTPKSEKTTKQLLGEFYSDKKCLETLLKDEDLVKGKTKVGERLQDVIQGCLTYLDSCTEFQEKPICAREKERKVMQKRFSKPRRSAPCEPAQFLLKSLEDIDAELTSGNAEGSLKKAEEVMKVVQGWSEKEGPNKKEVFGSLHSCIGNALIELGDMDNALAHHQKDLELAKRCKLPEAMSRALDNIGRVYAQIGQFTQAIEFWEKKIPLVRGGLEKTWLFHELGWCYLELGRYEEARDYGVRSVDAADEIADEKWQINANVLVAQSELKLGNFESGVSHFERALTRARLQEDDSAMNVIQKALDEAKQHLPQ